MAVVLRHRPIPTTGPRAGAPEGAVFRGAVPPLMELARWRSGLLIDREVVARHLPVGKGLRGIRVGPITGRYIWSGSSSGQVMTRGHASTQPRSVSQAGVDAPSAEAASPVLVSAGSPDTREHPCGIIVVSPDGRLPGLRVRAGGGAVELLLTAGSQAARRSGQHRTATGTGTDTTGMRNPL